MNSCLKGVKNVHMISTQGNSSSIKQRGHVLGGSGGAIELAGGGQIAAAVFSVAIMLNPLH